MPAPSVFIQSGPLGTVGLITDPPEHTLPLGAWTDVRNMRFKDGYIRRVFEPQQIAGSEPVAGQEPIWLEQWISEDGPAAVYASATKLFRYNPGTDSWDDVSRGGGTYVASDYWQSFAWGQSVIFNNENNVPQILYPGASEFQDLPNWGLISSNPADPQGDVDTLARCTVLRPYGNFLVAINVRENATAEDFPNRVWNSGPATRTDSALPGDNPSWDYADLGSLSRIRDVASEDGPLVDQLQLGAVNMLYTQRSATAMQFTNDSSVIFTFNRVLDYGIANIHAVAQFNNFHFCVGLDTVYTHDGANMVPLIDGRVQEAFFDVNPVTGTFQVEHYTRQKEIHILLESRTQVDASGTPVRVVFTWNYKDDTFSVWDAFTGTTAGGDRALVTALSYGTRSPDNTTWDDLTAAGTTWDDLTAEGVTWDDFVAEGGGQELFWIGPDGLFVAEADRALNPDKRYLVGREFIDLSELSPEITANVWKWVTQVYPHISTSKEPGDGLTEITLGWAENLQSEVFNVQTETYDPLTNIKADFRTTGRYLGLTFEVVGPGEWELSSMDFEVQMVYGR